MKLNAPIFDYNYMRSLHSATYFIWTPRTPLGTELTTLNWLKHTQCIPSGLPPQSQSTPSHLIPSAFLVIFFCMKMNFETLSILL